LGKRRAFHHPVAISFDQAILVAIVGLVVNAVSAVSLGRPHQTQEGHTYAHSHAAGHGHHDHNLRSAYLHVLADALTSMPAILALAAGKFFGLAWMDPVMGIVGATLVANWSLGLMQMTCRILLDRQGSDRSCDAIREAIESDGVSRVSDLHLWAIGPNAFALIASIATDKPRAPHDFKCRIPVSWAIVHVNVEVNVR
jgi:cation diffusion facilitator family transporter